MVDIPRVPIYCDCHGPEKGVVMGYRQGDRVVWYDKRHGQNHVKVLDTPNVPLTTPRKSETIAATE